MDPKTKQSMELKHLKAAYQLAEMNHKADPKNQAKKHTFDKALLEYEKAEEDEQAGQELTEVTTGDLLGKVSTEELEVMASRLLNALSARKADATTKAKEPTEAGKLSGTANAEATGKTDAAPEETGETSEDSKKNEIPS